jgi:hypothetical protein
MGKIIRKELSYGMESNKGFINNNLGLNIVLVENLIGFFTDAKDTDFEHRPENANLIFLNLKDILSLIHEKLPVTIFNDDFLTLIKEAAPKQQFIFEIYANDIAESNPKKVFYHFKYYALKNKSSKSRVFETLISVKERKQLINYLGKCLKAIEKIEKIEKINK